MSIALVSQSGRADPRVICPKGASLVELPAAAGVRVLRCMDDSSGQPHGMEIWLAANGFFVQRGRWEQGVRHGLWERWYPTGHLQARIAYNQGAQGDARCLTEAKRKPLTCDESHEPMDWQAPQDAPPADAPPADAPPADAPPADAAAASSPGMDPGHGTSESPGAESTAPLDLPPPAPILPPVPPQE